MGYAVPGSPSVPGRTGVVLIESGVSGPEVSGSVALWDGTLRVYGTALIRTGHSRVAHTESDHPRGRGAPAQKGRTGVHAPSDSSVPVESKSESPSAGLSLCKGVLHLT